jgi:hypothetical protein
MKRFLKGIGGKRLSSINKPGSYRAMETAKPVNAEIVEKFFDFLRYIFGKDRYDSEVDAKECLYYVKYMKSVLESCLDSRDKGQIPILEITVWATHEGKTEVTVNPSPDRQIQVGWKLSEMIKKLQTVINEWDVKDIGQKEGKVIDMMSKLGWVYTGHGRAG